MTTLRSLRLHDCDNLLDISRVSHLDLQDIPLSERESHLFADGSTLVINGIRRAGAAELPDEQKPCYKAHLPRTQN